MFTSSDSDNAMKMSGMDWTGLKNKKVFIRTRQHKFYTGVIKEIIQTTPWGYTIQIIDKFGKTVMIPNDEIAELKEE